MPFPPCWHSWIMTGESAEYRYWRCLKCGRTKRTFKWSFL